MRSDLSLLTTDYSFLRDVYQRINAHSYRLAEKNFSLANREVSSGEKVPW